MGSLAETLTLRRWDDPPRRLVDGFVERAAAATPAGSRVLDAGAGEAGYAPLFARCRYVACDRGIGDADFDYSRLAVLADAGALPFRHGVFDAVLSTQTLEHVPDPRAALREIARLLRPGGRLHLTVPFLGDPLHQEPHDHWRFTHHGLRRLLLEVALVPVEIAPMGGLWYLGCCHAWWFFVLQEQATRGSRGPLGRLAGAALQLWARFATMLVVRLGLERALASKFTYGYSVVAEKPGG